MNAKAENRYVVWGVGFGPARFDLVACTVCSSSVDGTNVMCQILENLKPDARRIVADLTRQAPPEIFEIESFPSLEEASEAIEFWSRYCEFLGLQLINNHNLPHDQDHHM